MEYPISGTTEHVIYTYVLLLVFESLTIMKENSSKDLLAYNQGLYIHKHAMVRDENNNFNSIVQAIYIFHSLKCISSVFFSYFSFLLSFIKKDANSESISFTWSS